jgi:sugar/nucleoside kinase (ribokinase family)
MARWDVVGLGENSVDEICVVPFPVTMPAKAAMANRRQSCGGQVATALCTCATLGLRAAYLGVFGDDDNGRRVRGELERRQVGVADAVVRGAPNRYAVILVDERTGDRAVFWDRHPSLSLQRDEVRPEVIADTRLLHVDVTDEAAAIEAARIAQRAGVAVTSDIDHMTDRTEELLAEVTVPIFAEGVPEALTGDLDIDRALRHIRQTHHTLLAVTLGARGAMLLEGDHVHYVPAWKVKVVDTTGAGDVFRGAFIHALLAGASPAEILRFANAAAAIACTRPGAIDSIPTPADVERLLNT